jgi:hypothetical protein
MTSFKIYHDGQTPVEIHDEPEDAVYLSEVGYMFKWKSQ